MTQVELYAIIYIKGKSLQLSTYKWGYKLKLLWVVFAVAKDFSYFLSPTPTLFTEKRERGYKFLKQHWDRILHDPSLTFLYPTATNQDQVLRMPYGLWTVLKQFMMTAFRTQHIISLTHPIETIRMIDFLVLSLSTVKHPNPELHEVKARQPRMEGVLGLRWLRDKLSLAFFLMSFHLINSQVCVNIRTFRWI